MKDQKGFSLIELLLVLAIIGIISAIAIPALLGQRERSRNVSTAANAAGVASPIQVALSLVEDIGAGSRGVVDLDKAATVADVLSAMGKRNEYTLMKNPFSGLAGNAYDFSAASTAAGVVGMVAATDTNGVNRVAINYGTQVKGAYTNAVHSTSPETSIPLK